MTAAKGHITFTIVYNNIAHDTNLTAEWGMACVIEGLEKCILFDTGSNGAILLNNMRLQNVQPQNIDIVFLSHAHWDHTGGLHDFLEMNNQVEIVVPASARAELARSSSNQVTRFTDVAESMPVCENVYSTGEMEGMGVREHALIIDAKTGLIVVTGCAHPGIVSIAAKATALGKKKISLLFGGFHLAGMGDRELKTITAQLHDLGVQHVGPSHCTGERAIEIFQAEWKDKYIDLSLGARFELQTT